jgi:hypothetical protein
MWTRIGFACTALLLAATSVPAAEPRDLVITVWQVPEADAPHLLRQLSQPTRSEGARVTRTVPAPGIAAPDAGDGVRYRTRRDGADLAD